MKNAENTGISSSNGATRLNKYISGCGLTSRRKAEELIVQGKVKINGIISRELGQKVLSNDVVQVNDNILDISLKNYVYVVFNKPRGCISSLVDPENRETVIDYMRGISERVFPVGRLDFYSEGLLILTNDGDMANRIIHPRNKVQKVYEVKVFGIVTEHILQNLKNGTQCGKDFLRPKSVKIIKYLNNKTWLEFCLEEGKNREIRRICERQGLTIDKLRRISIEGLTVDGIAPGKYRLLTKRALLMALDLDKKVEATSHMDQSYSRKAGKKAITHNKKSREVFVTADNKKFIKFRKQNYVETLKSRKNVKEPKGSEVDAGE